MNDERIRLLQGDITTLKVDAIVNAANTSLLGGGGVDGAIHRAAGPELAVYCRRFNGCRTGEARITPSFRLSNVTHIIHTPGPVWQGGDEGEPTLLAACYRHSLALAHEHGCRTIAFPAISCGIYGYPIDQACRIAVHECRSFQAAHTLPEQITFVLFSADDFAAYEEEIRN